MLPQPSQCREWWAGFLLIVMISVSLEPKWRHFAQVNIADIFMLSSKLPKQNENVSKSREKSYGTNTQTAPKQQKQQYFFLLCLGASLCNSGLLAGVKMSPEVSGSDPKWSLSGGPNIQPIRRGPSDRDRKWIPQDSHISLFPNNRLSRRILSLRGGHWGWRS